MADAGSPRLIFSSENDDFRGWLRLATGKPARGDNRILLEGEHLCRAWLDQGFSPLALLVAESLRERAWVCDLWRDSPSACKIVLADRLAAKLSQVRQGPAVYFVVDAPEPQMPARVTEGCLCLDRVQDPGNLGTLLRTAAAAGLAQAFLSVGCAAAWSPKVLRSGQGAHFALRIHERVDLDSLMDCLDVPLLATSLEQAESLYEMDLRAPCAWLFGNEGRGVAPALLEKADRRVRIPQASGVESLNVAGAAAVCLFEQRRQRIR